MKTGLFYLILLISLPSILLGQDQSSDWYIRLGMSEIDIYLNQPYNNLSADISVGRQLGSKWLVGGGISGLVNIREWRNSSGEQERALFWRSMWAGGLGRRYFKEINRQERKINPYLELGLGGLIWSSFTHYTTAGPTERVQNLRVSPIGRAGISLWVIPVLSLDFQGEYVPYISKRNGLRRNVLPHQLNFVGSLSYWFSRE